MALGMLDVDADDYRLILRINVIVRSLKNQGIHPTSTPHPIIDDDASVDLEWFGDHSMKTKDYPIDRKDHAMDAEDPEYFEGKCGSGSQHHYSSTIKLICIKDKHLEKKS